jgi:hypothetical protein
MDISIITFEDELTYKRSELSLGERSGQTNANRCRKIAGGVFGSHGHHLLNTYTLHDYCSARDSARRVVWGHLLGRQILMRNTKNWVLL